MSKILVPTDLSENSINALKYANSFATKQNAEIVLLNIYTGDISNYESGWPIEEDIDAIKPDRKKVLESIVQQYCTVPTNIEIIEGDVVATTVNYAKDNAVSIIIMGTHGASGLKEVFWGSNTSNVVAQSEVPVLAIPINFSYSTIDKIIYASDFKDFKAEINQIVPVAQSIGASIDVLHLLYYNDDASIIQQEFDEQAKNIEQVSVTLTQKNVTIDEPLTEHLKQYVSTQQHALLAMFTQERDWFEKFFLNSKTEELANDLELPIISFKKKDID
jgi:nucleotide-binding universal stress UspA family protein